MPRKLRSRLTFANVVTRSAIVLALATAGSLAVASIALAAANSTVPGFSFNPAALPPPPGGGVCGPPANGKLNLHTHTNLVPPGSNPTLDREQLFFDDDFCFNTNAAPKCPTAMISGQKTMMQAMAACGPPAGAPNNAWLWQTNATTNGTAQFQTAGSTFDGCVLIFNGQDPAAEVLLFIRFKTTPGAVNCANPANNVQGNASVLLKGDLTANPNGAPIVGPPADYFDASLCAAAVRRGCQIDIANIRASSPVPLTDLNIHIQRGGYIRARCVDPPNGQGNRLLNLQTLFTHQPGGGTQTRNNSMVCT